jgi:hypothetical protein
MTTLDQLRATRGSWPGWSARRLGLSGLVVALSACASISAAQPEARWTIATAPLLSLGGSGDSVTEFQWAESAIRLRNGDIVIANRRTWELRWFDGTGRHLRTLGRRGKGPREFGRAIFVYEGAGDTVVVNDADNRRYHYITAGGEFARLDTAGTPMREMWLYDRSVVERLPVSVEPERVRQALLRIPFSRSDSLRTVLVDCAGYLLVRSPGGGAYTVHDGNGRPIATLTLPPRFEPYQVLDSLVLGRFKDADDVEYIQVRRLTRGPVPRRTTAPAPWRAAYDETAELATHRSLVGSMRMTLRNMLTAQELHYAKKQRYGRSLAELGFAPGALPAEVSVTFVAATDRSYWLVAQHPSMRAVCIIGVGGAVPFGSVEVCG